VFLLDSVEFVKRISFLPEVDERMDGWAKPVGLRSALLDLWLCSKPSEREELLGM
jgi:hypothetical protein